jgi:hypothetical protein
MKKISINLIGADPTITFLAQGLWKITSSDGLATRLCVLNQTANQNMEDWGGYNLIDAEADTYSFPTGYSVSVKQYVSYATEFALTPPQGCLHNYRTLEEAARALEDETDIQGIILEASL